MIRKILVYEDALADRHPALERAMQLAKQHRLQLKVIDVVDGPSNSLRELHRPMRDLVEQERKDRLDAICQPLLDCDVEFRTELIRGRPFVEIVREVVHEGFHLVIKTTSIAPRTEVMGMMSPVDLRLVRNCPCPVWLEAVGGAARLERIMIAIDPHSEDDQLSKSLLEMGVSLAKGFDAELHIVSAWEVPDEEFLVEKMPADELTQYASDIRTTAQDRLNCLLAEGDKLVEAKNVHFCKGRPDRAILECVELHQPDVLLIGTVGHTNIRGLLIGNTTDAVLRQISCSVLAVKPESLFRV